MELNLFEMVSIVFFPLFFSIRFYITIAIEMFYFAFTNYKLITNCTFKCFSVTTASDIYMHSFKKNNNIFIIVVENWFTLLFIDSKANDNFTTVFMMKQCSSISKTFQIKWFIHNQKNHIHTCDWCYQCNFDQY